jgi:hypothetical protein
MRFGMSYNDKVTVEDFIKENKEYENYVNYVILDVINLSLIHI